MQKKLPDRIIEAIKRKRRPAAYKKRVLYIYNSLAPDADYSSSSDPSVSDEQPVQDNDWLPPADEKVTFNKMEETEIYFTPDIYANQVNSDQRLRGALTNEEKLLDEALVNLIDIPKCRNLVNSYILTLVKESDTKDRRQRQRRLSRLEHFQIEK